MCGIVGFVDGVPENEPVERSRSLVAEMALRVAHRGPDSTTVLVRGPFALGFTRLCIVDPDPTSQPFTSRDGDRVAAVNGTIYNHARLRRLLSRRHGFRTESDCEVVLHLYEELGAQRCLAELDGMFAAAVWDSRTASAFLLRDRFGVKPLYTYRRGSRVYFASEVKAFLAIPGHSVALDWDTVLMDPLVGGVFASADLPPASLFRGVSVVKPGSVVRLVPRAGGGIAISSQSRTWPVHLTASVTDRREALRCAVEESVRASLTIADVAHVRPSVLLSGGLDSAAIAAIGTRLGSPACYTIDHPATRANGDRDSSLALTRLLGLPLHVVDATSQDARGPEEWRFLLYTTETPMCGTDTLLKAEAVRAAADSGVRLMASGTGADEIAGGFTAVAGNGGMESSWASFMARARTMPYTIANLGIPIGLGRWNSMLPEPVVRPPALSAMTTTPDDAPFEAVRLGRLRDLAMFGLQIDDRIAASVGVECRVPFLTNSVAAALSGVSPDLAEGVFWDKALLRDALTGLLPDRWRLRPKIPFGYAPSASRYMERDAAMVLTAQNCALVAEAVENPRFRERFDHDAVWRCARAARTDTRIARPLLRLVNMSLLDILFEQSAAPPNKSTAPRILARPDSEEAKEPILSGENVLAIRDDVALLGDVRIPDVSPLVVFANGETTMLIDRDDDRGRNASELLRRIDGETPLATLMEAVGCHWEDVTNLLANLLDAGLITASQPAGRSQADR